MVAHDNVIVVRNSRSKNIKLRINHDGNAVVTAPPLVPMFVINRFVASKSDWIKKHSRPRNLITDGMVIGRGHVVRVMAGDKLDVRIRGNEIIAKLPTNAEITDVEVQEKLNKSAIKCLRKQAQERFPDMVYMWSKSGVGTYKSVSIKLIRSRWGSYSSDGKISLSLFMMQLPDELIEYIIVHELSHSVHMNHSKEFWAHVAKHLPDYKELRKQLRNYNMSVSGK
jgi:predicted metal-dependent hydrolase